MTCGSGPSSSVIDTSARAAQACGRRRQLLPSQVERGHRPVAVMSAWSSATVPSAHGHNAGCTATASAAPAWHATLAFTSSGARQGAEAGAGAGVDGLSMRSGGGAGTGQQQSFPHGF